jgi:hypothetical protein
LRAPAFAANAGRETKPLIPDAQRGAFVPYHLKPISARKARNGRIRTKAPPNGKNRHTTHGNLFPSTYNST